MTAAAGFGEGHAPELPAPHSIGAWVLAARPKTLVAGWAPVMVGTALAATAAGRIEWSRAAAALGVAIAVQLCTNFVNDAADHARGADTAERSGPPRAAALGLLSGRALMGAAFASAITAGLLGLWLASEVSWWLLIPGGFAIVAAIGYTAGPAPIAYLGLGELFVFLFFGLFATIGSFLVQVPPTGAAPWWLTVLPAIAMGSFAMAILEVNNIRDAPQDAEVGKRTLAVRLGDARARRLYGNFVVGPVLLWAVPALLLLLVVLVLTVIDLTSGVSLEGFAPLAASVALILPVLLYPQARRASRDVRAGLKGRDLNPVLGRTAQLMGRYALLVTAGLVLRSLVQALAPFRLLA